MVSQKGREWIKAKKKLVEIYEERGIAKCENCGSKWLLSFHHRPKRSSQRAEHIFEKTRLLCAECHGFFEYNDEADRKLFAKPRGYSPKLKIMAEKKKTKKAEWEAPHKCVRCGKSNVGFLICPHCGFLSVKK